MIIYGTKMYGRRAPVRGWGQCEHCGHYGKHISYNGRQWFHLYFIPVVPVGSKARVVKQCGSCQHGLHMPETETPQLVETLQGACTSAVAALLDGEDTFQFEEETVDAATFLWQNAEMLHCLGADEFLSEMIETLHNAGVTYAHRLAQGAVDEFHGNARAAATAYEAAARLKPDHAIPWIALGSLHFNQRAYDDALASYETAHRVAPEDVSILGALLPLHEARKNHERLCDTYEQTFQMAPQLRNDKQAIKAYKKACKKVRRTPVVG